jgi:hypothetical protein
VGVNGIGIEPTPVNGASEKGDTIRRTILTDRPKRYEGVKSMSGTAGRAV